MADTSAQASVASLPASTQVLVAGGGPVGLATAVELGQRGIECLITEPRMSVSHARPRCKTINVRSMEHLRRWGIADRLRRRAPLPVSWSQDIVFCTSLAGRELSRFSGVLGLAPTGNHRFSESGQQAPQYVLEELLRAVVDELDACTLAAGCTVKDLEQDSDEVRMTVADQTGQETVITGDYAVGCDGPRSMVREQIGSRYVGEHALRPNFGMVFHAPELWQHLRHGRAVQYWIINSTAPALMGPIDRSQTWWIIAFGVDREVGERAARQIIDAAAGTPVEATVLSTDPWTAHMQLVDRLRCGRVFLAGDAAHLNPPFGGHGLNTGVGDAVDLGWKLAAVLDGWGGPALLDSYERERRPVQERVLQEATANMEVLSTELLAQNLEDDDAAGQQARHAAHARIQESKQAEFHALDLVLGIGYEDSPVIPSDGTQSPGQAAEDDVVSGAWPGVRLPHAWLNDDRSLYDELGAGLTLLVVGDSAGSDAPIVHASRARGVPLKVIDLSEQQLRDRYEADLVLVRPDQHVVWRGDRAPDNPLALIDQVRGANTMPQQEPTHDDANASA